jgi:hypothetical protein
MKRTRRILWITLILAAMLIPTAIAFAKEITAIDVTGPGISGTLTLDNMEDLLDLQEGGFFDSTSFTNTPSEIVLESLGEGYHMNIFMDVGQAEPALVQEMIYYPDPAGEAGFVHWLPRGDAEIQLVESDRWTRVRSGEDIFQGLMLAAGVDVVAAAVPAPVIVEEPAKAEPVVQQPAAANPAAQPEAAPTPAPAAIPWGWLSGSVALIALVVGALLLRQRSASKLEPASASQD